MSEDSQAAMSAYIRAMQLPETIRQRIAESPLRANTYTINHRVKPTGKILEKVERKRAEGRVDYNVDRVSDIVGFRLITLFSSEVIGVVGQLLDLIMHKPEMGQSPFAKGEVSEILIFDNRPQADPLSIVAGVKAAAIERGFHEDLQNRWGEYVLQVKASGNGYSSVHVICHCDTPAMDGVSVAPGQMPIEIQVRTIFEDAWGEIDHKLKYKPASGQKSSIDVDGWRTHLIALKTISDGCVQYAEIIRRQSLTSRRATEMLDSSYASVDTPAESLKRFTSYPEPVVAALKLAFEIREQAFGALHDAERQRLFLEAIDAFDAALRILESHPQSSPPDTAVARMTVDVEKALCMLSSNDPQLLHEAVAIYEDLTKSAELGIKGVSLYRKGQALMALKQHHVAIGTLIGAEKLISTLDEFQKHWLRTAVPRNLGYAHWQHSGELTGEARKQQLEEAITCTVRALAAADELEDKEGQQGGLNNLVCYQSELLENFPGIDDSVRRELLGCHVDRLKNFPLPGAGKSSLALNRLHSLATACSTLRRTDDAKAFVERFLSLCGSISGRLDDKEEVKLREALSGEEEELFDDILRIHRANVKVVN